MAFVDENTGERVKISDESIRADVKLNNSIQLQHRLKYLQDKTCQICFTPTEPGYHYITFYKDGQKIDGSTFKLYIPEAKKRKLKDQMLLKLENHI